MRKIGVIILLFTLTISAYSQQEADIRIASLINKSNYFALEREYPVLKRTAQADYLKLMAEISLGINFNRPDSVLFKIDKLIGNYQAEIGFENTSSYVAVKTMIEGRKGNYANAADIMKDFIDQLTMLGYDGDLEAGISTYEYWNSFRNCPMQELIRPDKDVEIPFYIEKAGKGTLIYIPVTIHGKQYKFIFDTGAEGTFMSERLANEAGVDIVSDYELEIQGAIAISNGMYGYLDSLQIGNMTLKNSIVSIIKPNEAIDTIFQIDAVIGLDFMKLASEVQIDVKNKMIVFPSKPTPLPKSGRNMFLDMGRRPIIEISYYGDLLPILFDTGNVASCFQFPFYERYKSKVDSIGVKDRVNLGGIGGINSFDVMKMPPILLKIGDNSFDMKDIVVFTSVDAGLGYEYGNFGISFITLFSEVTINFQDLFIEVK